MQPTCIHLYCGSGKGKTTAALGQLLRTHGAGLPAQRFCFLKDGRSSEVAALRQLGIPVCFAPGSGRFFWQMQPAEKQVFLQAQRTLFEQAAEAVRSGAASVIALDEVLDACSLGVCTPDELRALLNARRCELILTGREGRFLLPEADYYTEMTAVKHPYDRGLPARRGIEF